MKKWITLEDGGSGRWLYVYPLDSDVPAASAVWVFTCIQDLVDCCGRDADYYFIADVAVVDLVNMPATAITEAIRSCDGGWIRDLPPEKRWIALAQCCFDYGAKSPCWEGNSPPINKKRNKDWQWQVPSDDSPTFTRLRAKARRFVKENLLDAEKRNTLLDTRIVNKLGQTAREYSGGAETLWDTLRRIKSDPDATAEQRLVLKMYQSAKETLGAGPVPADLWNDYEGKGDQNA